MSELIAGLVLLQPFGKINHEFMDGVVCVETHHNPNENIQHLLFELGWTNDNDNPDIWYMTGL